MIPASRGISPGLVGLSQGVDECGAPGFGSRVRSRSSSIRLIEKPVVNSDDSDFDDFKDSEEGPDLGLGEEPEFLLDYLTRSTRKSGEEPLPIDARSASPHGTHAA